MVTHKPVTLTIKGQLEQWDVAGAQCLDLCDFFCINLIKFMFIFKMMDTEIPCSRELESSGDKTVSRCKRVFLCWLIEHGWGWII